MISYDFLAVRWVILHNVGTESNLITYFINFLVEMGQIMNRYDFLEATEIIVINIWTDLNWYFLQSVHIHFNNIKI